MKLVVLCHVYQFFPPLPSPLPLSQIPSPSLPLTLPNTHFMQGASFRPPPIPPPPPPPPLLPLPLPSSPLP